MEHTRINNDFGRFNDDLWGRLGDAGNRANEAYNTAFGGYNDLLGRVRDYGGGPGYGDIEGNFKELYNTGGLTDENRRRIRGGGVFDEFAKTGGIDDRTEQLLRSKGTATLPSFYQALRTKLDAERAANGESPGYNSQIAAMARDEARGVQDAANDVELGITDRRNEGRRWGASSMSGAELGIGNIESANKRAGLEGMLRARGMGSDDRLKALGLEGNILDSIRGLRTDSPGELNALLSLLGNSIQGRAGAINSNIGTRMGYTPNTSFWDRLPQFLNAGAGVAAAFA